MSTLQAIPTQHGIDILNSELKNTVTKYRLIGALTHNAPSESLYSFYENTIETSYYDENGVLTFILNLPIEQHFDEYLHQIHVLDSSNQSVIECSTPKVALPKGIGGMVKLKAAISGEAGQVIFKHSEFVTETELLELHLPKYVRKTILNPSDDLNKNFGEGHFYFTNSPAHNPDCLTDGYHFFLDRNITHYGNAKDVLFSIEPVGTKVKKFVRYQISGQWQPWERVATLSNINESLEDKLNHLPIYPETLTSDNKAVLTLSGTTLTVAESNVIALRGWNRIKASDYALEQRQFTIDLSNTYHLRFNVSSGFYLEDLASASYNPTSQPQTNSAFDSTLDNVLIAAIESGVVTAYRNVTELPINIARLETTAAVMLNAPAQNVECMRLETVNDYARGFTCNVSIDAVLGAALAGATGYGYLTAYCDGKKTVKQRMHLGTSAGLIGYYYDKNVPISCQMPFNRGAHVVSLDNHLEYGQYCFNTDPAVNGHVGWQKSVSTIDIVRV
ncbi:MULTISPECIES: hypothetical protein [Vibrio]|uniref:hypothetical protein n=1 Tax=Vibrio TaxID=662 RepID=UPI001ABF4AAC|nr:MULTISPECIES: hypothetical protein [Vibrio]